MKLEPQLKLGDAKNDHHRESQPLEDILKDSITVILSEVEGWGP